MFISTLVETPRVFAIEYHTGPYTIPCEVGLEIFIHINAGLSENQQEQLLKVLKKQVGTFGWEYIDMKGIHPDTACIHHIYMDANIPHVRQP